MSENERPEEERGQDELIAAFAALGGRLTADELMRLLGSEEYYSALVRLATLLLDGDTALAEDVTRDSLAALQRGWSPSYPVLVILDLTRSSASCGRLRAAAVREHVGPPRSGRRHRAWRRCCGCAC
jgi:hypothetical protein